MRNNALININMIDAAARKGIKRYFFSSAVCIYRDMQPGEPELKEAEAYPALPANEYGWEKLSAERVALAFGRKHGMEVRIARFQNCYGPEGAWTGGREKAPAAICRKVAEAMDGGTIEVWGDGKAIRSYTYVDDMVRSEEHTSELQSRLHLVCRLLLEKKKNHNSPALYHRMIHPPADNSLSELLSRFLDQWHNTHYGQAACPSCRVQCQGVPTRYFCMP